MNDRRRFLVDVARGLVVLGASDLVPRLAQAAEGPRIITPGLPDGTNEAAILDALPGKRPLIKRTYRPANYETPVDYFDEPFTPNDAFFVRYHLAHVPEVEKADWKLAVGGESAERPFTLGFDELTREFEQVELAALCLCSGNRRGLSDPHVAGVQWGFGAMGNARFRGVRLKDVLAKAGIRKDALEVVVDGADRPALPASPRFAKSLPVWKALDENTLLCWEMNGAPLPHWNGYPVRLVVPGWTGTYWMKHITSVGVVSRPFTGFFMASAYRIPREKFPVVDRFISQENEATTPITEIAVSSLVTSPRGGERYPVGQRVEVRGIAWDGGYGMGGVDVSTDGGASWRPAALGKDLGRFAWRTWSYAFRAERKGTHTVVAKATNRIGGTQTFELNFNPGGYHNNVVQRIEVHVA